MDPQQISSLGLAATSLALTWLVWFAHIQCRADEEALRGSAGVRVAREHVQERAEDDAPAGRVPREDHLFRRRGVLGVDAGGERFTICWYREAQ